jgi:hypothetical protein
MSGFLTSFSLMGAANEEKPRWLCQENGGITVDGKSAKVFGGVCGF